MFFTSQKSEVRPITKGSSPDAVSNITERLMTKPWQNNVSHTEAAVKGETVAIETVIGGEEGGVGGFSEQI